MAFVSIVMCGIVAFYLMSYVASAPLIDTKNTTISEVDVASNTRLNLNMEVFGYSDKMLSDSITSYDESLKVKSRTKRGIFTGGNKCPNNKVRSPVTNKCITCEEYEERFSLPCSTAQGDLTLTLNVNTIDDNYSLEED